MNEKAVCPICNQLVPVTQIDAHANLCLDEISNFLPSNNPRNASMALENDYDFALKLQEQLNSSKPSSLITDNLQQQRQSQADSSTGDKISCQTCKKSFRIEEIYILDECNHKFCRPCLYQWVESRVAVDVRLHCPLANCKKELSVRDVKEFLPKKGSSLSVQARNFIPSRSTPKATQRLHNELMHILNSNPEKSGYSVAPINDNLFHWELKFFNFDKDDPLHDDMKKLKMDHILLHISFPATYPFNPPFVRVIRPRFIFHTGHVTIGGSICMEVLTNKGWSPEITVESIVHMVRAQFLAGGGRLDLYNRRDYTEAEAKEAFDRLVRIHGWY
jgi:ubiquitin-protein ligase